MSEGRRTWTVARLLAVTSDYLAARGSASPRLDAELLLAEVLGEERISLYVQPERPVTGGELSIYREFVRRRAGHEPMAYLLGRTAFRYLTLKVTPEVLIPRPETEELVDAVLDWLASHPLPTEGQAAPSSAEPPATAPLVVDVGTGSGAIALSVAHEAGVRVLATDTSEAALDIARANAHSLGLEPLVTFQRADLCRGLCRDHFRLVVANPPYVSTGEYTELQPDVRDFEPASALLGGEDGLSVIRRLIDEAFVVLAGGGALLMEIGEGQAGVVEELVAARGFCRTTVISDLSGKERIVRAQRPGALVVPLDHLSGTYLAGLRDALLRGSLIGLPTDTVYGLAAAWRSERGVRGLFEAKGRSEEKVLAAVFASPNDVLLHLSDLDELSRRVLAGLLPGPYTFIVRTNVERPALVGGPDSLGVRVPDHEGLLRLLEGLDVPLALTSANRSGQPDPPALSAVDTQLLAHCAAAFDRLEDDAGGGLGAPSTVVDLRPLAVGGAPAIVREGAVPREAVFERINALVC